MSAQLEIGRGYTMAKAAELSACGRYRYRLTRVWDEAAGVLTAVLLNPSTADHEKDDPTLKRLVHFARAWRYGGVEVLNLFAYRSPTPDVLMALDFAEAEGQGNRRILKAAFEKARATRRAILVGYGRGGAIHHMHRIFLTNARFNRVSLMCLGLTREHWPIHPLARGRFRVPDDAEPVPYLVQTPQVYERILTRPETLRFRNGDPRYALEVCKTAGKLMCCSARLLSWNGHVLQDIERDSVVDSWPEAQAEGG